MNEKAIEARRAWDGMIERAIQSGDKLTRIQLRAVLGPDETRIAREAFVARYLGRVYLNEGDSIIELEDVR
jgi:hypothetical protein